ncbi:hypothetical protein Btru_058687 [Bulinus truncatus]|nr:hypothetical protein Btru_058687 [Bulinus truncatus]
MQLPKIPTCILWNNPNVTSEAIAYGNKFEDNARKAYKLAHRHVRVIPSGLWIHPYRLGPGTTPDAVLMDPSEKGFGILEIKCPFLLRDMTLSDAFDKLSVSRLANFRLQKRENGYLLKENHKYYSQVQTQMGICGFECHVLYSGSEDLWFTVNGSLLNFRQHLANFKLPWTISDCMAYGIIDKHCLKSPPRTNVLPPNG